LEITGAKAVHPAQLMDISFLVEVVAVLTDVVQLGVDGRVIFTPAFFRHPTISFAIMHWEARISWVLVQQGQPRIKSRARSCLGRIQNNG